MGPQISTFLPDWHNGWSVLRNLGLFQPGCFATIIAGLPLHVNGNDTRAVYKLVFLSRLCLMFKKFSSEYNYMHSKGTSFRAPVVKNCHIPRSFRLPDCEQVARNETPRTLIFQKAHIDAYIVKLAVLRSCLHICIFPTYIITGLT